MTMWFTAIAAAFFVAVSLKFLQLFHFIKWNPIHFLNDVLAYEWSTIEKWSILFFLLIIVAMLIYLLAQTMMAKSPLFFSLLIGCIIAILLEWRILNLPIEWDSIKKLSVPFLVIVLIALRFIAETAQYFQKQMFR